MSDGSKKQLTRRQALTVAGTIGAGAALGGAAALGAFSSDDESPASNEIAPEPTNSAGLTSGCLLTPSMTEGPYFVDERFDRRDIRGGQAGVPLKLTIRVLDVEKDCEPYPGAVVDIWQCNAQGVYSDVSNPGNGDTVGQTWLRGMQRSDRDGEATFRTIYPGWYPGRTIHIHFKVRTFQGESTTYNFTSQLFFPEDVTDQVMSNAPAYSRQEPMTVTNSNDRIFSPDLVLPMNGSYQDGFTTSIDLGLTGLPA